MSTDRADLLTEIDEQSPGRKGNKRRQRQFRNAEA
jgi:hypothetical protein